MVCSGSALNMISLYNRNCARYSLSKQGIAQSCSQSLLYLHETNMHGLYTQLMYGKYTLFYESSINWGYYVHVEAVCTRSLLGEGPGDEAI